MALVFASHVHSPEVWLGPIRRRLPDLDCLVWPDVPDPEAIEFALVWGPQAGVLKRFRNLKAIFSTGAGVEHIFADPELPDVPVVKAVDRLLTKGMTEYVLLHVLRWHRRLDHLHAAQAERRWTSFATPDTPNTTIGILGVGEIGSDSARALAAIGFRVAGWSRTPKALPGIESFHGPEQLAPFLGRCDHLVCLLPLTPETRGLLNRRTLALLKPGAFLINAGRGPIIVDDDLLAALDSGQLAGATLDVFHSEPLPLEHPFWSHPKVLVTPHNASDSVPATIAADIAANISGFRAGQPLKHVVSRARGY
jgi:glyoxylate/hydroxypyruvate reductase A